MTLATAPLLEDSVGVESDAGGLSGPGEHP